MLIGIFGLRQHGCSTFAQFLCSHLNDTIRMHMGELDISHAFTVGRYNTYINSGWNTIIEDCKYKIQASAIKEKGGYNILLVRPHIDLEEHIDLELSYLIKSITDDRGEFTKPHSLFNHYICNRTTVIAGLEVQAMDTADYVIKHFTKKGKIRSC